MLLLAGCTAEPEPREFVVRDPYAHPGSWTKGNFHLHSPHSDGIFTFDLIVRHYGAAGYGVVCVTDHNQYGDQDGGIPPHVQTDSTVHDWNGDGILHHERRFGSGVEAYVKDWTRPPPAWARDQGYLPSERRWQGVPEILPGAEATYHGWHIGVIGHPPGPIEGPNAGLGFIGRTRQAGGLVYLAHPAVWNRVPARLVDRLNLGDFHALEVINGFKLAAGQDGDATPLWDALLARGYRLWGLANDDAHLLPGAGEAEPFTAFNMLLVPEATAAGFLEALHRGSFYGTTGILFATLGVVGDSLVAVAPGAERIRFLAAGGLTVREVRGAAGAYVVRGSERYVRVEALGPDSGGTPGGLGAWSQPFFVEPKSGTRPAAPGPEPNLAIGEPDREDPGCGRACGHTRRP